MYSARVSVAGETVDSMQLRVIDLQGKQHIYSTAILYTSLATPDLASGRVIQAAFDQNATPEREAYRTHLIDQLQRRFPALTIRELQLWHRQWTISDPFSPSHDYRVPDEETMIASFSISDVAGTSS